MEDHLTFDKSSRCAGLLSQLAPLGAIRHTIGTELFFATRVPAGIGPLLTLDEFFVAPSRGALPFPTEPDTPMESLLYYLEPRANEEEEEGEEDEADESYLQPKHGIQIHLSSTLKLPRNPRGETSEVAAGAFFAITHVREYSDLPVVLLGDLTDAKQPRHQKNADGSSNGKTGRTGAEGATVRVVAGDLGGVMSPPPLTNFVSRILLLSSMAYL